jgi:hypothetical protein
MTTKKPRKPEEPSLLNAYREAVANGDLNYTTSVPARAYDVNAVKQLKKEN